MTADEFESLLAQSFWVMDGPPVAYFELPAEAPVQSLYRVAYTSIRMSGPEPHCWIRLLGILKEEAKEPDSDILRCLFWRKRPEYADGQLYCRVAVPGSRLSSKGEYYHRIEFSCADTQLSVSDL